MPTSEIHAAGPTTFTFITLGGIPTAMQERVEEITRPGVDGHAFALLGLKGEPFQLEGVRDYDDLTAAKAALASLESLLPGSLVTVYDDFERQLDYVLVLDVRPIEMRKVIKAAGGKSTSKGAILRVVFTMQRT